MSLHLDHNTLVDAARDACALEGTIVPGTSVRDRYNWLTEAELTARLRSSLLAGPMPAEWARMNAQGRKASSATNHDLEFGESCSVAIEVVYLWGAAAPSPGKPLDSDLQWLVAARDRHVVAFLPRLRGGYRIQNHKTPYDRSGSCINLSADEFLLSDALQLGGLSKASLSLCSGVFDEVQTPMKGKKQRWSLADSPAVSTTLNTPCPIYRSIASKWTDRLWAVVWSNP